MTQEQAAESKGVTYNCYGEEVNTARVPEGEVWVVGKETLAGSQV